MKKIGLLFFAFLAILGANAQNYDWNFSNSDDFPATTGVPAGESTTINGLTFNPGATPTNFGAINANEKTVDDVVYTMRMQFNGAGYTGATDADVAPSVNMPTQRYLSFEVNGNITIDIVGVTGSSGSSRKIFLTDGTNLVGAFNFPSGSDASKETVSYSGGAATLYLFCNAACNVYRITVTEGDNSNIRSVNVQKEIQSIEYFDLTGKKIVSEQSMKNTVLIKKITYTDGTISSSKILTQPD